MLGAILRKKLSDEQFAKMFVGLMLDSTEKGFADVAQIVNEDKSFVKSPKLNVDDDGKFTLIVVAGNMQILYKHFNSQRVIQFNELIYRTLAPVYELSPEEMKKALMEYSNYMVRVNHPSKNTVYAMSKVFFYKYDLAIYQDEYFRNMQCPNPLFLKRMDEIMEKFVLNWEAFFKRYRLSE